MIEQILVGAVGGLGWSILGIAREKSKPEAEEINGKKIVKTVIVGGVIGGILGYQGSVIDVASIEAFVANSALYAPIVAIADKVVSLGWELIRRVF